MALEGLPNEVLLMIVRDCHDHDISKVKRKKNEDVIRGQVVCNLALTSQKLKEIAEPVLYETIPTLTIVRLLKFLRSVLNRPVLGLNVTRFSSADNGTWRNHSILFRNDSGWKVPSYLKQVIASIDSEDLPGNRDWIQDLYLGRRWDCVVATAMIFLPKLRCLSLRMSGDDSLWRNDRKYEGRYKYIHKILRHATTQGQSTHPITIFAELKTLAVKGTKNKYHGKDPLSMASIAAISSLATIRKLIIETNKLPYFKHGVFQSTIRSVEVRLSHFSNPDLEHHLGCFPMLHEFRYVQDHMKDHRPRSLPINDLVRTLIKINHPLRRLQITPTPNCTYHSRTMKQIESLANFELLYLVEIPAFDLWGNPTVDDRSIPDIESDHVSDSEKSVVGDGAILDPSIPPLAELLPVSIKHLILTEGSIATLLHVRDLLQVKHERTPNLKDIRVLLKPNTNKETVEEARSLEILSTSCGVSFKALSMLLK